MPQALPAQLPTEDDVFNQFAPAKKAQAAAPPPKPPESASDVAYRQTKQIPQGLMDLAASFSPVRTRGGITEPTLEVPEVIRNLGTMMGHITNPSALMQDVAPMAQPLTATARGAGALAESYNVPGFHNIQAPSQEEFEAATRGATQQAAGLVAGEIPKIVGGIQTAATRAGIPQRLAHVGAAIEEVPPTGLASLLPKWARHPSMVAGLAMRPLGKALSNPEMLSRPTWQLQEYTSPEPYSPPYNKSAAPLDVPYRPVQEAPAPPHKALPAYEQPKIEGQAPKQKALPAPAPTQPLMKGQEGGLAAPKNEDVVAQHPRQVKGAKGEKMRPETPNEMKDRLTNLGRQTTKQPTAEAEPFKSPAAVKLPNSQIHMPSSAELEQGYVLYRNDTGQFQRYDLPGAKAKAPTPPPKKK